jgi:hypothetical protein
VPVNEPKREELDTIMDQAGTTVITVPLCNLDFQDMRESYLSAYGGSTSVSSQSAFHVDADAPKTVYSAFTLPVFEHIYQHHHTAIGTIWKGSVYIGFS